MKKMNENNKVEIVGMFVSSFRYSHKAYGETFYIGDFQVERLSDEVDIIPVMVSDRLIDINADWLGEIVKISGQFRSYNRHEGNRNRLLLSVFAKSIEVSERCEQNNIFLDGYICKIPIYRKTPLGREIADVIMAVNRQYGKSDYIPCIAWGRNSRYMARLEIGSHIKISGRIQSRQYNKRISEIDYERKTAYEVSICTVKRSDEEEIDKVDEENKV